jgi:hypothetical protein
MFTVGAPLFNQLFIDYYKDVMFESKDLKLNKDGIREAPPTIYQDDLFISAAISLFMKRNILKVFYENGTELYQVTPEAIKDRDKEREDQKLNEEIDIFIKQETKKRLIWERWQKRNRWVSPLITILLSAFLSGCRRFKKYNRPAYMGNHH